MLKPFMMATFPCWARSVLDIHTFKGDSDLDEEVIYLWSRFFSLDICPAEEQEKKNRRAGVAE